MPSNLSEPVEAVAPAAESAVVGESLTKTDDSGDSNEDDFENTEGFEVFCSNAPFSSAHEQELQPQMRQATVIDYMIAQRSYKMECGKNPKAERTAKTAKVTKVTKTSNAARPPTTTGEIRTKRTEIQRDKS